MSLALQGAISSPLFANPPYCISSYQTTALLPTAAQSCFADFFNSTTPLSLESNLRILSKLSQNPAHEDVIKNALYRPGNALYRLFFGSGTLEENLDSHTSLGKTVSAYNKYIQTGNSSYAINTLDSSTLEEAAEQATTLISRLTTQPKESPSFFQQLGALIQSDLSPPDFLKQLGEIIHLPDFLDNLLPGPTLVSARPIKSKLVNSTSDPSRRKDETQCSVVVHHPIPDMELKKHKKFSFGISNNTFSSSNGSELIYSAKQMNGNKLPSWINFNSTSLIFSGKARSKKDKEYFVELIAENDCSANSASFELIIKNNNIYTSGDIAMICLVGLFGGLGACVVVFGLWTDPERENDKKESELRQQERRLP